MHATISINGGSKQSATLDAIGTVDGETCYQALIDGVLVQAHELGIQFRVVIDNGINLPATRPIRYTGCVDCQHFEMLNQDQPVMTRASFTVGYGPERYKPTRFFNTPRQPQWNDSDVVSGWSYGIQKPPTDTGARAELSVRDPNWILDRRMRRAYADADGIYPTSNRDPVAPYLPIARDGYTTGYNSFSHEGWKAGHTSIGRKPQLPHLYANSDYASEVDGDWYYRDSVIFTGNYAAMYNGGAWPNCASELRGIGRGLRAMIAATRIDGNSWRKDKIVRAIESLDSMGLFGTPFTIKTDPAKGKYVTWWEHAYLAYAIALAIDSGFVPSSSFLNEVLNFQASMNPSNVGCYGPYWLLFKDQSGPAELTNFVASNQSNDREAELYVFGELMRRRGMRPPRPLDQLMLDESKYPIRNHASFFIAKPVRYFVSDSTNLEAIEFVNPEDAKTFGKSLLDDWSATSDYAVKLEAR